MDSLDTKIGTTGRGIGPTYADKINRVGLRFGDVAEVVGDEAWTATTVARMNASLEAAGSSERVTPEGLAADIAWIHATYASSVGNTGLMLDNALKLGEHVILEGAQGCLLDIDQGTFPYVTSSVTSRGNATHGAGIHPGHVKDVIGITKAYITRVGHGAMPTELDDEAGEHMGTVGHEFGTTTGRKRRCGWFDAMVVRKGVRTSGVDMLALTKLDVLSGLDPIRICTGYELDGKRLEEAPASADQLERVQPIFEECRGWTEDISNAKSVDDLPAAVRAYIARLENLVGVPVGIISVGPARDATITLMPAF